MTFSLPDLPYAYDALQPYMSKETLEFHHDKHHKAYLDAMTPMIEGTEYASMSIEDIVTKSYSDNPKLFNQAGQYYNHLHFWNWMKPNGGGRSLPGRLEQQITRDIGSIDEFRQKFIDAGKTQFGSGWAWLALDGDTLKVLKTPNGENPLVYGMNPLMGIDVWEHSYYVDYENRRPEYVAAWLNNLVNWDEVEAELQKATA